jgi:hypothetical protein
MNSQPVTHVPATRHRGPNLGIVAMIFTVLFLAGLYPVTVFGGMPYFPGPWESASTIATFFRLRQMRFSSAPFFILAQRLRGIFTATVVSQLRFHPRGIYEALAKMAGGIRLVPRGLRRVQLVEPDFPEDTVSDSPYEVPRLCLVDCNGIPAAEEGGR